MYNQSAMAEIKRIVEHHAAARYNAAAADLSKYNQQFHRELDAVVNKYGAKSVITRVHGNGLECVTVMDSAGRIVCEYTRATLKE